MEKRPARVAAIHDLSGFGRCSVSVILPVLSAMGVQVCPVLTAVLSTHTGGFGEVVFRDLTDYIKPSLEHYKNLDIDFEAIYSGFLGSEEQVDSCLEFFKSYPDALKIVDPVMGDNGKIYSSITPEITGSSYPVYPTTIMEKMSAKMKLKTAPAATTEILAQTDLLLKLPSPTSFTSSSPIIQEPPIGNSFREYLVSPLTKLRSLGPIPMENSSTRIPFNFASKKCPNSCTKIISPNTIIARMMPTLPPTFY